MTVDSYRARHLTKLVLTETEYACVEAECGRTDPTDIT